MVDAVDSVAKPIAIVAAWTSMIVAAPNAVRVTQISSSRRIWDNFGCQEGAGG